MAKKTPKTPPPPPPIEDPQAQLAARGLYRLAAEITYLAQRVAVLGETPSLRADLARMGQELKDHAERRCACFVVVLAVGPASEAAAADAAPTPSGDPSQGVN